MTKTKTESLADAPRYYRSKIVRGLAVGEGGPVDRAGGDYGAGLIRGFAVITRGEALGHDVWIDGEFLQSVSTALNDAGGSRVRFTHPGMSSDGLGKKLGKAKNARLDGDVVRGDLHFSKTSHTTPDGDLADYTMNLAEEDPDLFGASIVYSYDYHAEKEHYHAHVNKETGRFESPDPLNVKNLPHARLAELHAVDVVDEPAANPTGMFHASDIPAEADSLIEYAIGWKEDRPELFELAGVHPDRLRSYLRRFFSNRGLPLPQKDASVSTAMNTTPATPPAEATSAPEAQPATPATEEKPTEEPAPEGEQKPTEKPADDKPADPASEFAAQKAKFTSKFGAVDGCEYLAAGLSYEQACEKHIDKLSAANKQLSEQKKAALAAAGDETPVDVTPADGGGAKAPPALSGLTENQVRFAAGIKLPGKN